MAVWFEVHRAFLTTCIFLVAEDVLLRFPPVGLKITWLLIRTCSRFKQIPVMCPSAPLHSLWSLLSPPSWHFLLLLSCTARKAERCSCPELRRNVCLEILTDGSYSVHTNEAAVCRFKFLYIQHVYARWFILRFYTFN